MTEDKWTLRADNKDRDQKILLANIKTKMSAIDKLLQKMDGHWGIEDGAYRFYHHSYKVFDLQHYCTTARNLFLEIAPQGCELNDSFESIVLAGTSGSFDDEQTNTNWESETRPILEAAFHCRYFLAMMSKYGKEYDEPPQLLDSGWAAVLYLYWLR